VLGELLICAAGLQAVLDAEASLTEAWSARANDLVEESVRIGEAVARASGHRAVRVEMSDGSTVVADSEYLNRLVHKMHRHHSLGLLQLGGAGERELIAS
jgi:hypothetical protein